MEEQQRREKAAREAEESSELFLPQVAWHFREGGTCRREDYLSLGSKKV